MIKAYPVFVLIIALSAAFTLAACAGGQDAARSRSEYVSEQGATLAASGRAREADLLESLMPAEQLRVEEYLNYYAQSFPAPQAEQLLAFHVALGNTHVPASGGEVWLQVALQAAAAAEREIHPLNVALVLDKSGSMADEDKMDYLKQSLRIFLDALGAEDIISIVIYDSEAQVLLPARSVGDGQQVRAAIDGLQPGGYTNIHGGLMLGFGEVQKNFDARFNNRVILLTDGIANRGITDPDQIAADALAFNQQGIFLSTIGLGLEFNDELLRTLAEQGKGNYHFISDADEMERVFRQEAAGLVQTVATDVWLTLDLSAGAQVQRVYGYAYDLDNRRLRVQFDDAGAESSQVLMIKLVVPAGEGSEQHLVHATLDYDDPLAEVHLVQQADPAIAYGAPAPYNALVDPAVRRNATILQMAEALQQVSYLAEQRQYEQVLSLVQEIKPRVWQVAIEEGDEELQEDVTILGNYESILQKLVELAEATPVPVSQEEEPMGGGCIGPIPALGLVSLALVASRTTRRV